MSIDSEFSITDTPTRISYKEFALRRTMKGWLLSRVGTTREVWIQLGEIETIETLMKELKQRMDR